MSRATSDSAVVLLSSGLDSTFNLYKAREERRKVLCAITFDYGQKAAPREIERSRALCAELNIAHRVVELPWFRDFTSTALVGGETLPQGEAVQIDNLERSHETAKSVWVPNRNGILLNIAAGFAEGLGAAYVIPGFNIEEAETFPDNTSEFLQALEASWAFSTATQVKTLCFSARLNKIEIVREGARLGLPFEKLWPCYLAEREWCGQCESCLRYKRALAQNGLSFDELNRKAGK